VGELHDIATDLTLTVGFKVLPTSEKNKAFLALEGGNPPTPSSRLVKDIVRLAKMDPPAGTPPPIPVSALDPLWARDGVFVRSLSSFHGQLRSAARAAGFSAIYIQLDHSADVAGNIRELNAIGADLIGNGWRLAGWSTYGQGTDPKVDGRNHAQIRRDLAIYLDGWIGNGETWAEDAGFSKSSAYIQAWRENGGFGPLAVSCMSSDNPNWARSFDYPSWLSIPGAAIMPQVYGASFPAYTVINGVSTMANGGVPRNRLALTFDVINGSGPFANYRTWAGPRSIWTGDDSTVDTWAALDR
jgi:hypothetical protein